MAMLALKALNIGAEKIPDKAFHAIPGGYFRPPDADSNSNSRPSSSRGKQGKMRDNDDGPSRDRHRERRKSDDYSASESGNGTDDETRRRRARRPTRRNRRYTSSQNLERGYDSDGMTHDQYQQSRGMPQPAQPPHGGQYFPPPPAHAFEDGPQLQSNAQPGTQSEFDPVFNSGSQHYHPQTAQYYGQQTSPEGPSQQPPHYGDPRPGPAASSDRYRPSAAFSPPPQQWESKRSSFNPSYQPHAGYANNYQDQAAVNQAYQPSHAYYPPQATQAPYDMPPSNSDPNVNRAYPTYVPPQDNWTPERSPSRDRHRRHRSRSRGGHSSYDDDDDRSRSRSRDGSRSRHRGRDSDRKSKSRNRSKSIAKQAKDALKDNRDVASSALGVVAGGLIANQIGRGNKYGTIAGAVLGGLGANLWEKKHGDRNKELERKEKKNQELVRNFHEKRQQLQRMYNEERSNASQHGGAYPGGRPSVSSRSLNETATPYRERSKQPYIRSRASVPMYEPIPASPHVHFSKLDPKNHAEERSSRDHAHRSSADYSQDRKSTSWRSSTCGTRDASTQTTPPPFRDVNYKQDKKHSKKSSFNKSFNKGIPAEQMYAAARSVRKQSRCGTWDGSVVEEVFMEMTGVSIGDKEKMKSNWKN